MISSNPPLTVVQISDCHLGAKPGEALLGMDTDRSLDAVLDTLSRECADIDLLIVSGDLANHGSRSAYERLHNRLLGCANRIVWLPGNHDDVALMRDVVGVEAMPSVVELGGWKIALLNSAVSGEVGGSLAQDQLDIVASLNAGSLPTVLFLHHHLLNVGCDWLDEQRVDNAALFFERLSDADHCKAVISGHVHQVSHCRHAGLDVYTSPSTCVQFAPNSRDFAVDKLNPGYRVLELADNGELTTRVSRVTDVSFFVDMAASGY
ncbi:MAG: metallophosphoesterase [Spongiibacteraceae bacterium]